VLHIIQNDPEVPPGTIVDFLAIPFIVHHPYRDGVLPEPEQISALIVMGGAMGANDEHRHPFLSDLKHLIRSVVAAGIPYLGVCLGGQLLAAALGAKVISHRWEELGTLPVHLTEQGKNDRLFKGIPQVFTSFQWHHDSFDIPDDGVLLASSGACRHQAFLVGTCAWGVQFHPEVTETIIRSWCAWDRSTEEKTDELTAAFCSQEKRYRNTARHLMGNFLSSCELHHPAA
jgi:GMP synthase-like glutamine amidotransferase